MKTYDLSDENTSETIKAALQSNFSFSYEKAESSNLEYYDTFDWLIYNESCYLAVQNDKLILYKAPEDTPLAEQIWTREKPPRFWWDLPKGNVKDQLKSIIDARALMRYGSVERTKKLIRILNADQKTTVFTEFKELIPENGIPRTFLAVKPLRGYHKEYQKFIDFLVDLGLTEVSEQAPFHYIQSHDRKPGDYSSKIKITLEPSMKVVEAMSVILLSLFEVAKKNIDGMKEDIDTEFLHDFRVAIRRTRSALSEIKGVYKPSLVNRFQKDSKTLGKATNRLRDLDVYLMSKDDYYGLLPDTLKSGLDVLFSKLAKQRRWEQKKLVRVLESQAFKRSFERWEDFIAREIGAEHYGKRARDPVIMVAREYIYAAYKKVIKLGSKIDKSSPDDNLHKLRIKCKKLRYLMEFFLSLFPAEKMDYLIKQLKKLQDNLGDFNDYSVQQETMQTYLKEVDWSAKNAHIVTAALGGLISGLNLRQKLVREAFEETFVQFTCEQNTDIFEELFNPRIS